jgi:hypothetical protein
VILGLGLPVEGEGVLMVGVDMTVKLNKLVPSCVAIEMTVVRDGEVDVILLSGAKGEGEREGEGIVGGDSGIPSNSLHSPGISFKTYPNARHPSL